MAARISLETLSSKIAPANLIPRFGLVMEFAGRRLSLSFPASFSLAMVKNSKMPAAAPAAKQKGFKKAATAPAAKRRKDTKPVENVDTSPVG